MLGLGSRHPIGIDIEDQRISAVQLEQTGENLSIRGLWHGEFDAYTDGLPEEDDALVSVLKSITKSKRFKGKSAVVHLPSQNIISFPIRFQIGEEGESVDESIFRESGTRLSFPIEDAILDYPTLIARPSGVRTDYRAIVTAVHRDHVKQYMSIFKQAGLTVEAIDFGVASLIRVHEYLHGPIQNTVVLCHLGFRESYLSVVTDEGIIAQRDFTWGFQRLLDKILANLELPDDKAMFILNKYGLAYEELTGGGGKDNPSSDGTMVNLHRALYQIITPYIDELVYEFHTITSYMRSEEQNKALDGIYMYGCASMMQSLGRYVSKRIDLPVEEVNPLAGMDRTFTDDSMLPDISEGAPFALALGLAMRKVSWL